jgi:hypothetical protein
MIWMLFGGGTCHDLALSQLPTREFVQRVRAQRLLLIVQISSLGREVEKARREACERRQGGGDDMCERGGGIVTEICGRPDKGRDWIRDTTYWPRERTNTTSTLVGGSTSPENPQSMIGLAISNPTAPREEPYQRVTCQTGGRRPSP